MATYNGPSYEGRTITATITETATNAKDNTSTISWKIEVSGGAVNYYDAGAYLKINGTKVCDIARAWNSYEWPAARGSQSGTMTIAHGADGRKSIEIDFQAYVYYHSWGQYGGTMGLSNIDRTTPTITLGAASAITEASAQLTAKANYECENWQYKLNDGSWTTFQTGKATETTLSLSKLSPNATYTVQVRATRTHNGLTGTSGTVNFSTLGASKIINAANVTIGTRCNVTWIPYNADYKYKLKFICGSQHVTTNYITPGTLSPYTYDLQTIPMAFCSEITTAESGDITAELYTYDSNNQQIGVKDTKTFKGYIPASVVPVISGVTFTERGNQNPFDSFVASISKLRMTAAVSKAYGSPITRVTLNIGTDKATYTNDAATYTLDTGTIYVAGLVPYTATVTDARGRTTQDTGYVNIQNYFTPGLRPNIEISGTTVTLSVRWEIAPVAGENTVQTFYVDRSDGTTTERHTFTVSGTSGTETWTQTLTDIQTKTYTYTVTLSDKYKTATARKTTGTICFSRLAGGKGAAFGKSAERQGLEVDWPAYFNYGIYAKGHTGAIGETQWDRILDGSNPVTVSANSETTVGSFTLPAGTWLSIVEAEFVAMDSVYHIRIKNSVGTLLNSMQDTTGGTNTPNRRTQLLGLLSDTTAATYNINFITSAQATVNTLTVKSVRIL